MNAISLTIKLPGLKKFIIFKVMEYDGLCATPSENLKLRFQKNTLRKIRIYLKCPGYLN